MLEEAEELAKDRDGEGGRAPEEGVGTRARGPSQPGHARRRQGRQLRHAASPQAGRHREPHRTPGCWWSRHSTATRFRRSSARSTTRSSGSTRTMTAPSCACRFRRSPRTVARTSPSRSTITARTPRSRSGQARREANDLLKKAEKDKDIGEDDLKRGLDNIQSVTDTQSKVVDDIIGKKEKEILDG